MNEPSFPPVTIIIPNYNGAHLLQSNLPAVIRAADEYLGVCEIIVVDDGSYDDSAEMVRREFPDIHLIEHPENLGFAEAIHSGVNAATTELLIFLNSDVHPYSGFMAPLVRHFNNPDIFSVAPLIVDNNGRFHPSSWRCYKIKRLRFLALRWSFPGTLKQPWKTLYASGGSMMLRKSMFLELGGFLPIFKPFYSEDFDLGLRAWRRGWISLFDADSRVIHGRTGSIRENFSPMRIRATRIRNQFLIEWMHLPAWDLIIYLIPGYFFQAIRRLLTLNLVFFWGLFSALIRLPAALRLRSAIRKSDTLDFWKIMYQIERSALVWAKK